VDIDIVIAWVDGADPAWLAEKARYPAPEDDSPNRYRELGLLKFWFRSIEAFAPWARKIHFVTWGHIPPFLSRNHPKLNIVRHEDFIPAKYLPTFNSHTIELNLHRIPGLSEHFVYFNDDMFLLRPAAAADYFREGLPCVCAREEPWVFRSPVGVWSHAAANGLGVINRHFPKGAAVAAFGRKLRHGSLRQRLGTQLLQILYPDAFTGFVNVHGPSAFRKATFRQVWAAEEELLDAACRRRFRSAADLNQWVMLWWQVASGAFYPQEMDNLVMDLSEENISRLCHAIRGQSHEALCVNDPGGEVPVAELIAAFEELLPEKSGFEL